MCGLQSAAGSEE